MENGPVEWINGRAYQQSTKTWKGISPIMKKYVLGITLVSRQDDTDNADTTGRHPEVWMILKLFQEGKCPLLVFFFLTQVVLFGEKKVFKLFPWTIRRSFFNKNWMSFLFFIFIFSSRCWSLIICLPDIKSHSFPSESPAKLHQIFFQITKAKR